MYICNGVLPQASYITSALQQMVSRVKVEQLVTANDMLAELLKLKSRISFPKPPAMDHIKDVLVTAFCDASFNQSHSRGYGQSGILTGLRIGTVEGLDMFHPIYWCSNKQRRVSYSPYGTEVLACSVADDRGNYFKTAMNELFPSTKVRNELLTDSKCLYDTLTTLHEGRELRLRTTVQRILNSFDSQELNIMRWIAGTSNPSDALTKRNPKTSKMLNDMLSNGLVCMDLGSGYYLDSQIWK